MEKILEIKESDGYTNDAKAQSFMRWQSSYLFKTTKDNEVEDLSFEGEGCAISLASASILTEIVKEKIYHSLRNWMRIL